MKQQITVDDLEELTESQRKALNALWLPRPLEKAVARVCRNAETEEYEFYEFVIGGFTSSLALVDLRALFANAAATPTHDEPEEEPEPEEEEPKGFLQRLFGTEDEDEEEEDGPEEGEPLPEGWDTMTFDSFSKVDCLPLPTISRLIEYLQKLGYGEGQFRIGVGNESVGNWVDLNDPGAYRAEYEADELCDALWAALKDRLR